MPALDPFADLLRPLGLSRPLGLLRDVAWTAEQLGRSALGQDHLRLAVTGLSRSGKTVFITSLLANLLAAGQGRRVLPALEQASGGRLRDARLVPAVSAATCLSAPDGELQPSAASRRVADSSVSTRSDPATRATDSSSGR